MAKKNQSTQQKTTEQETPNSEGSSATDEQKSQDTSENTTGFEQAPPNPDAGETNSASSQEPNTQPPSEEEMVDVLALVDNNTHGLKCGYVYSLPYSLAEQLHEAGVIDAEEPAVAGGIRPLSNSEQEPETD